MSAIPNKDQVRLLIDRVFVNGVPHNVALGIELVDFEPEFLELRLPYSDKIVGNPETGVIHGGAVTTLMDAGCGGAVMIRLGKPMRVATLDLRIDYLRPGKRGEDLICRAECYRVTKNVAFTRGITHDGDPSDPVASCAGTFIIFRGDK
jgi:uncharacterized protein (TIGR00369 family)